MEVQVRHNNKLVKPSSPTPSHLRKLKLSFIDQHQGPYYPGIIFYYHAASGDAKSAWTRVHRLEESLAETLTIFYPLAGRNGEEGDNFVVTCNDQGAQFVKTKVNRRLDEHLLDGGASGSDMLLTRPVVSTGEVRSSLPLLLVQVNVFECGGLAVSVQCLHAVSDMSSISKFIHAWATTSREGITKVIIRPSFDTGSLFPIKEEPEESFPLPMEVGGDQKLVLKRFVFNAEALSDLRAKIMATFGSQDKGSDFHKKRPSRVELVTALISRALISIDQAKTGQLRPMVLVHSVNFHTKTQIPIPQNAYGNLFVEYVSSPFLPKEDSDLGLLCTLFVWLRDGLKNFVGQLGKVKDPEELRFKVAASQEKLGELMSTGDAMNLILFTSWCDFPVYDVNFGWGAPGLVSGSKFYVELIFLRDTKTGDGIEAWVTLEEDKMSRFKRDLDILRYANLYHLLCGL
ncbi:hypothetical protein CDL15_Pgr017837 [Punica granatum]|uniref:Acetyl-CoA-benzylalcohol acetyltransferase-like n=1 Tax=Punica granatum TaxID=22663 RepID=A0A218WGH9_PUNGR|nr:hypothetical protein CDL15_Pgr017837 [Punica granatum]